MPWPSLVPKYAPDYCQLEERVLLSATPLPSVDVSAGADPATADLAASMPPAPSADPAPAPEAGDRSAGDYQFGGAAEQQPLRDAGEAVQSVRLELVFVDTNSQDYRQLVDDLLIQDDPTRELEIYLLDARRDGVEQISEILAGYSEVDALHLISHGSDGRLQLGSSWLGSDSVRGYAGDLAQWGQSLAAGADLLIYGCDLAGSEEGRALADAFGALCGCDVAASSNATGHERYGGDWELEYHSGSIETATAIPAQRQQGWQGKLSAITVTTTSDVVDADDGLISLREAIQQVNAGTGGDMIVLASGTHYLNMDGSDEDLGATGDLDIFRDVTIVGDRTTTIIDGSGMAASPDRVFDVQSGAHVAFAGLTVRGGHGGSAGGGAVLVRSGASVTIQDSSLIDNTGHLGGAIENDGILAVNSTNFRGNSASSGGAIDNRGTLTLTDVTFTANSADSTGGGLSNHATATLNRVTFSGNTGDLGGGIFHDGDSAVMTLANVTLSGNTATNAGAGIWASQNIHATNVTIAYNTVTAPFTGLGGGVMAYGSGNVTLLNSILFNNTAANGANANRALASSGYNISDATVIPIPAAGDQSGVDPLLAPLANNGGFTQTHALQAGSPAIDGGTATGAPATDQRGYARVGAPDIGSFESDGTVLGNSGAVAAAQVTVEAPDGVPPVLVHNRGITVPEGGSRSIANFELKYTDTQPANRIRYIITGGLAHGHLELSTAPGLAVTSFSQADIDAGQVAYVHDGGESAADSFHFTVDDSQGRVASEQTLLITILPINDRPAASDGAYSVPEDQMLIVKAPGVLAGSIDVDSNQLTAVLVGDARHGLLSLASDGSFHYTPNLNFHGTDTFTYVAIDGTVSNLATVSITVHPVNDAPLAADEKYAVGEDGLLDVLTAGVLNNDSDVDGDTLTAKLVSGPTHGTVTLRSDGTFLYLPHANYHGPDSFTYRASDGARESNLATVSITISPVNDAPQAVNDKYEADEDRPLEITTGGILSNDSDPEGDTLTAGLVKGPSHGALTLQSNGSFRYTPDDNFQGTDSFTYRASDGTLKSNLATVTITVKPVDDAPLATGDHYFVDEGGKLEVPAAGVLGNDKSLDGRTLVAVLITGPANGVVKLQGDGSFRYTPGAGFRGDDHFTYLAADGRGNSAPAVVTITVRPVGGQVINPGASNSPRIEEPHVVTETAPENNGPVAQSAPTAPPPPLSSPPPVPPLTTPAPENRIMTTTPATVRPEVALPQVAASPEERPNSGTTRGAREVERPSQANVDGVVVESPYDAQLLIDDLAQLREEINTDEDLPMVAAGSAVVVSSAFSVGYVLWTIRSGWLVMSLMAQMPAWRLVDPLIVLDYLDDDRTEKPEKEEDDSLESLIERNKKDGSLPDEDGPARSGQEVPR